MASIAVLIIMLGCAVLMFFKGTVLRALASIIVAICALVAAFAFFELLANFIIGRADKGSFTSIAPIAQPICFTLIYIIVFAGLQTLVIYFTQEKVDLGLWPERIGRPFCGLIVGFIVSGSLVTVLGMTSSLPMNLPYERFESSSPKLNNPKKVLFNADGFVTNLFSKASNGSLSGKRSFSVLHANYLDQIHMNRLPENVSILTSQTPAIVVPSDKAVWPASDRIKEQLSGLISSGDLNSSPGKPSESYTPMIVRIGFKKSAIKSDEKISAGTFTASQLRLICKKSSETQEPLSGTSINVFPAGHLTGSSQMEVTKEIKLEAQNIDGSTKDIDFVFCIPNGYAPVLVEFKLNNIAQISQSAILKDISEAPDPAVYRTSTGGGNRGNRGGGPGGPFGGGGRGGNGMRNPNQTPPSNNTPEDIANDLTDGVINR